MVAHYKAAHITLHVRKSNRAAISLYRDTLGFEVYTMEKAYCMSGRRSTSQISLKHQMRTERTHMACVTCSRRGKNKVATD